MRFSQSPSCLRRLDEVRQIWSALICQRLVGCDLSQPFASLLSINARARTQAAADESGNRSPHSKNMTAEEYAAQVRAELKETWLPHIYRQRILSKRTRSYNFEGLSNKSRVEIQHTLLGVELKAGRRRFLCPD